MFISFVFRASLGKKNSSGALCGFRGQSSAQSKRYHTIEYKLILYAILLGLKPEASRRENETRIKRNFELNDEKHACAVYASDLSFLEQEPDDF